MQGDTILESEYILLMAFLGRERTEVVAKAARYVLHQQIPEGGWNNYPDDQATSEIQTTFMNSPDHRANILGPAWAVDTRPAHVADLLDARG